MNSLTELEDLKKDILKKIELHKAAGEIRIRVGMATCGIAAGAKPVMNTLIEEVSKRELSNVSITITGCIGVCRLEPMIEVIDQNGERVTYVKMTSDKAKKVISEHIVNGKVVTEYTIGASQ
jgi:NADP-reducing hydrogenase subunit HndB